MRVRVWFALFALYACAFAACGDSEPAASAKASVAVRSFFDAAQSNDCAGLQKVLVPAGKAAAVDQKQCDAIFADFQDRRVRLVSLGQPKQDGRVKTAWMIMADVEFNGVAHQWLMRAELHDGIWKVRF
jgi:hypothetical protein